MFEEYATVLRRVAEIEQRKDALTTEDIAWLLETVKDLCDRMNDRDWEQHEKDD